MLWYLSHSSWHETPSSRALVSVAVPYSSVPQIYKVLKLRARQYLFWRKNGRQLVTVGPDLRHPKFKTVPGEYVCTQSWADNVTQVRNVVDIGQCWSHQDVSFAILWETNERQVRLIHVGPWFGYSESKRLHFVASRLLSKYFAVNCWKFWAQFELGQFIGWVRYGVCCLWRHVETKCLFTQIWQVPLALRKRKKTHVTTFSTLLCESHWTQKNDVLVAYKEHTKRSKGHGSIAAVVIRYIGRGTAG